VPDDELEDAADAYYVGGVGFKVLPNDCKVKAMEEPLYLALATMKM
jgi:hypothetical protein